jgi:tetratricopeptide (TPR) repeat protein
VGAGDGPRGHNLSKWVGSRLRQAFGGLDEWAAEERTARLARAKDIAARIVPLPRGRFWGEAANEETCGVRLAGGRCGRGQDAGSDSLTSWCAHMSSASSCLRAGEYELAVVFAQAEVALAKSLGQRPQSQHSLMHGLHMLGRIKEAEQSMNAYLLHESECRTERAMCINALARVLRDQGRLSEALERAEEATGMARTIDDDDIIEGPDVVKKRPFLDTCLQTEASILERMGRLGQALIKDSQLSRVFVQASLRLSLGLLVAQGRLEDARDLLRRNLAHPRDDEYERTTVEGPDQVVRAKELLCQVLHSLGGEDPRDAAEEAALRPELRQEEARRGEVLREVRAFV